MNLDKFTEKAPTGYNALALCNAKRCSLLGRSASPRSNAGALERGLFNMSLATTDFWLE